MILYAFSETACRDQSFHETLLDILFFWVCINQSILLAVKVKKKRVRVNMSQGWGGGVLARFFSYGNSEPFPPHSSKLCVTETSKGVRSFQTAPLGLLALVGGSFFRRGVFVVVRSPRQDRSRCMHRRYYISAVNWKH